MLRKIVAESDDCAEPEPGEPAEKMRLRVNKNVKSWELDQNR